MRSVDPQEAFPGKIAIIAPHMDDEVLACGGLIARLAHKEQIHLIYATDGMRSPAPVLPAVDAISPDLGEVRVAESAAAMKYLGLPEENLCFLRLPEARLQKNLSALRDRLINAVQAVQPEIVFVPFRYDRHPDHLAINRVITRAHRQGLVNARIVEYFVYHRWRLLPGRDIRSYIRPECLVQVDTRAVAHQKRTALSFFKSQTEIYFPWQTRPILTTQLLDEESQTPEFFLLYQHSLPGTAVFSRSILWIRIAHRVEPVLQKWKYLAGAFLKRALTRNVHPAKST